MMRKPLSQNRSHPAGGIAFHLVLFLFAFSLAVTADDAAAEDAAAEPATNAVMLTEHDYIETVSFIIADNILSEGRAFDDVFWAASGLIELNGIHENDAWLLSSRVKLGGVFEDHVRILANSVSHSGMISNGLWAVAGSITASTNSVIHGDQLLTADSISLLGHIEGDVLANARQIVLGGTIVGNLRLRADDIVVRPGTTIVGDLVYITTNQSIVLDPRSNVSGKTEHIKSETANSLFSGGFNYMLELYFFGAALLVGIPYILLLPGPVGRSVQMLRFNLPKCGLAGLVFMVLTPLLVIVAAFSVLGVPFALVTGTVYALMIYLGKFPVALAVGSALLGRRGSLSVSGAIVALVTGLFLFYSMALFPFVGTTLQTVAAAFGAGSLIVNIAAGRGSISAAKPSQTVKQTEN